MIHILLLILKGIGILLLALLGLVLLVIGCVAFVPVRYEASGSWKEGLLLDARVSWLFRLISLKAECRGLGDEIGLRARILGFTVWTNEEPEEEPELPEPEHETEARAEREPETGRTESLPQEREEAPRQTDPAAEERELYEQLKEDEKRFQRQRTHEKRAEKKTEKKPGIVERLKHSFSSFCGKLKGIRDMAADEKNQASIALLLRQLKRLIAHVWPGKGRLHVVFGFEDPYTTGQVLSAASLIYPFYHRQLELEPVFGERILEVEGNLKGRIRVWNLIWLFFGIWRDKHTWRLVRRFLK